MNSENPKNLPAVRDDGSFENCALAREQVIQGETFSCVDGRWSTREGNAIPADKQYIVLGTVMLVQRFQDGMPCRDDVFIRTANKPLPDVDKLNAEIPEEEWDTGIDGEPRAPWVRSYAFYLLDPVDASIHAYINSSGGAEAAFKLLNDRVKWKRMLVDAHVFPIVVLGRRLHSKKFNKFGPNLIVVDYRDLSHGMPAEEAPRQLEQQQAPQPEPVKQIGKPVREPTWAEILDDDLPDDLKSAPTEQAKPAPAKQAKPKKTAAGGDK